MSFRMASDEKGCGAITRQEFMDERHERAFSYYSIGGARFRRRRAWGAGRDMGSGQL